MQSQSLQGLLYDPVCQQLPGAKVGQHDHQVQRPRARARYSAVVSVILKESLPRTCMYRSWICRHRRIDWYRHTPRRLKPISGKTRSIVTSKPSRLCLSLLDGRITGLLALRKAHPSRHVVLRFQVSHATLSSKRLTTPKNVPPLVVAIRWTDVSRISM